MTPLLLLLVFSLLSGTSTGTYGAAPSGGPGLGQRTRQIRPPAELRLTTNILEQKYCTGNQLRMKLRLTFTNAGSGPLILFKYGSVIYRRMVSADAKAAAARRYKDDVHMNAFLFFNFEIAEEPTPGDLYVVLKPGEVYETDKDLITYVSGGAEQKIKYLPPGDYVLQIQVSTWTESPELADRMRERWKEFGAFWTRNVTSAPMPLRVEGNRAEVKCS
jgi:hypothetical protein